MSTSEPSSGQPRAEYQQRLDEARADFERFSGHDSGLSTLRWVSFVATVVLLGLCAREYLPEWLILPPLLLFLGAVLMHGRYRRQRDLSQRRVELYEQNLRRLSGQWTEQPVTGARFSDAGHVYSGDLDIFGPSSLFQLIWRGRTHAGEDRLADWFSSPADKDTVLQRQTAVTELRTDVDLREELSLLDAEVSEDFDQRQLLNWATQACQPVPLPIRVVAIVLAALSLLAITAWASLGLGPSPLLLVLVVQIPFLFALRNRVFGVASGMDKADEGLHILSQVLDLIENRNFDSPFLQNVRQRLHVDGQPPSRTVRRLARSVGYLNNSLRNQFFAPIAMLLCLPLHLVHSIETWRSVVGQHIEEWLDAVGDFEATVSIAGYAYEHPDYPFPEISEAATHVSAQDIGHPLLPPEECIRNSLTLNDETQLLLVSGSNMSGKSTLLRTIGTNTVLALAGAPVNARSLTVSCLQIGTAMRVSDSLQEGKSLFFAVLGRLKSVVDLASGDRPLLFLLDEILQGTNSHDRRQGAEAVIRSLVQRGAIGMVTTHDLALTEIEKSIPGTENVHFEDTLVNGEMTFDYQLRPGVVQKSNAIELMRLVGLDV